MQAIYIARMSAASDVRMTVDDYLAWAQTHPGRYELIDGIVHATSPERLIHAKVKAAVYVALLTHIRRRGLPCHAVPDGMTVRIDPTTAYEPNAQVYCGAELPPSALEVPNPVIVVEVLSKSTKYVDVGEKLPGYFMLPSVMHYLIVDPDRPLVIHHARTGGDLLETRIVRDGAIELAPPGVTLPLAEIYAP